MYVYIYTYIYIYIYNAYIYTSVCFGNLYSAHLKCSVGRHSKIARAHPQRLKHRTPKVDSEKGDPTKNMFQSHC